VSILTGQAEAGSSTPTKLAAASGGEAATRGGNATGGRPNEDLIQKRDREWFGKMTYAFRVRHGQV
jgi:hypothetical protein